MCFIDLEPCEVWRETERKARKTHRCDCCRGEIPKGAVYLVHFDVFDGEATSEKMCLGCRDDRQAFANAHGGTLCLPSDLLTMLIECIAENDPDDRRWVPMRDRIKNERRQRAGADGAVGL